MSDNVIVEVLAAHADQLAGNGADGEDYLNLFPTYRAELAPLLGIAERLKAALIAVEPATAFEAGLRQDLMKAAIKRAEEKEKRRRIPRLRRRGILIGAAAVGSALSVAGIIAALLLRQRALARA